MEGGSTRLRTWPRRERGFSFAQAVAPCSHARPHYRDSGQSLRLVGNPVHRGRMSARGQTRKSVTATRMSAFGGRADIDFGWLEVRL